MRPGARGALALLLLVGVGGEAGGQAAAPAAPPVRMEEVEIRGEVERPEVFYVIPRREVRMDLGPLTKDYRAELLEPLLPGPFEDWVRQTAPRQPEARRP